MKLSTIAETATGSGIWRVITVTGAGLIPDDNQQAADHGVWKLSSGFSGYLSRTQTIYDGPGRVAESVNADGLRSATVYYSNGQVKYSGTLQASARATGLTRRSTPIRWYTSQPRTDTCCARDILTI